jgi:hypothetical protein
MCFPCRHVPVWALPGLEEPIPFSSRGGLPNLKVADGLEGALGMRRAND